MNPSFNMISSESGNQQSSPRLFQDVAYVVIHPPIFDTEDPGFTEALEDLDQNGATQLSLTENGRIADFKAVTHIISKTVDFPDYVTALDMYIPVVKPTWIRNSLQKGKQPNPRSFSPDPALFLSDVTLHCADIPEGDKEAIIGGVIAMGGLYSEGLSKLVTHLVALSYDDPKVQAVVAKKLDCKIVIPHWFDDCLRLRRRISVDKYLLPDPEVLRKDLDSPPIPSSNPDIFTAMRLSPDPSILDDAKPANVFKKRQVMLSQDLNLSKGIRESIEQIIIGGGGVIAENIDKSDIYVCQYREDKDFAEAYRAGKDVGSLNWLYHLIAHDRWTNPLLRLLHFPIPRHGIPGFEGFVVAVSNYTGNARIYLENLLKASGARYTKTMTAGNTHLVAAHTQSEKYSAAREWAIEVVNHLWLEDSFAQNRVAPISNGRYTHFPNRTNLGEIIGQTPVDRAALEKGWLRSKEPKPVELDQKDMNSPTVTKKAQRKTMGDVAMSDQPTNNTPNGRHSTSLTTPRAAGKENKSPSSPALDVETPVRGGRGAKAKALSALHDAAMDIQLYNKEKKRVGGVVHGKDRHTYRGSNSPKRKRDEGEEEEEKEEEQVSSEEEAGHSKKARIVGQKIKVMVSKYEKWEENPGSEQADKTKLRNLGIHLIDQPPVSDPFILCAPRIVRTRKFVCALAYAPEVLSTAYLDYCLSKGELPPEADMAKFRLRDQDNETKFLPNKGSLARSLKFARENDRKLLKDWQIFCTANVPGSWETYKDIVEVNGGTFFLFTGKSKLSLKKQRGRQEEEDDDWQQLYLVSGTRPNDKAVWEKFETMAKDSRMEPVIVSTDWLLGVTMGQDTGVWLKEWQLK